jgi:hypothetical protein
MCRFPYSLPVSGEAAGVVSITRIERPGGLDWSPTARIQRGSSETARCTSTGDHLVCPLILLPSLLVSLFGGLPDRFSTARGEREPSILSSPSFQRGGQMVLACAHRGTTVLSWGLCEQEGPSDHSLLLPSSPISLQEGGLDWSPTAHVERPQFHRGGSVSTRDQPGHPHFLMANASSSSAPARAFQSRL